MPIGCWQAFCVSQQQVLYRSFRRHLFWRLDLFSFHLASSQRSFSWKLLIVSQCRRSLRHSISSHLTSSNLISSHLVSSLLFSAPLSWSQLFSSLLMSPELLSSLLSSSELFSFQLFSASPFYAAPLNSSLLSSSLLFSALRQLLSSHLILAHLFRSTHVKSSDSRCSNPFSIFLLQFISSSVIFLSWLAWPHASVVHQAFPSLLISCQEKQEKITLTQQSGFG